MQDKNFKVKIFEVTHKSMKTFSLKLFRLYGIAKLILNWEMELMTFNFILPGEEQEMKDHL